MADNQQWYYQIDSHGPFPLVRGPVSLEEVGVLIRKGAIRSDTLVRFGIDTRWYAASRFVLLKRFLEPAPSHAKSPSRKLPLIGLAAAILVLVIVYFPRAREMVPKYDLLPLPERAMTSPSQARAFPQQESSNTQTEHGRKNRGLPPLSENRVLDVIASERADDMIQKQYFSHYSPSGEGATDVAQRAGYPYKHLGENIAMGSFQTDDKIVTAWMQSPGHRQNILSEGCSEIGVAVKRGRMKGEEVWWQSRYSASSHHLLQPILQPGALRCMLQRIPAISDEERANRRKSRYWTRSRKRKQNWIHWPSRRLHFISKSLPINPAEPSA